MSRTMCVVVIAAVMLAGCAKAPEEAIKTAEKAIEDARAAGAGEYAREQLAETEKAMAAALGEISKQNKTLIGRDYSLASRLLGDVGAKAAEATAAAKSAAAQAARDGAEAAVNRTYAEYQKASKAMSRNAKAKPRLDAAMANLKEAQAAMQRADYAAAMGAARSAEEKISAVTAGAVTK